MPTGNSTLLNIRAFLADQERERYRAFMIHGKPLSGKTAFARKLAAGTGAIVYFDLLKHVAESSDVSESVDTLDAGALGRIVVEQAAQYAARVLLVDELDFLVHTWGGDLDKFKRLVEKLHKEETPAVVGFILQTRPELEDWELPNTKGQNRILRLDEIKAL